MGILKDRVLGMVTVPATGVPAQPARTGQVTEEARFIPVVTVGMPAHEAVLDPDQDLAQPPTRLDYDPAEVQRQGIGRKGDEEGRSPPKMWSCCCEGGPQQSLWLVTGVVDNRQGVGGGLPM